MARSQGTAHISARSSAADRLATGRSPSCCSTRACGSRGWRALVWPDIKITERKGILIVRSGKGAKFREVPLNDEARKAFQSIDYPGDAGPVWIGKRGPLTVQGLQKVIEGFGAAAGIDLSCHILRHTFCHDLLAAGVGLEKVAALAGHDSIETTRRYVEPSAADLQDAVDQLGERKRA